MISSDKRVAISIRELCTVPSGRKGAAQEEHTGRSKTSLQKVWFSPLASREIGWSWPEATGQAGNNSKDGEAGYERP